MSPIATETRLNPVWLAAYLAAHEELRNIADGSPDRQRGWSVISAITDLADDVKYVQVPAS